MPRSDLVLRFSLLGPTLDPYEITAATGLTPTVCVRAGEVRRTGMPPARWGWWRWQTGQGDWDIGPLVGELLAALRPHRDVLVDHATRRDAAAQLAIVGSVYGDVVSTKAEAERRRIYNGDPFQPFLDADRVGLFLPPELIAFLADLKASVDTHIELDLDHETT